MSEVTEYPAPDLTLSTVPETPWQRECRAFWELRPTLLNTHNGQYVAIQDGKVVASGKDEISVALEAYSRVGYGLLYVGLVTNDPPRPVRIPSPRIWLDRSDS
jgi:hypothetical protein